MSRTYTPRPKYRLSDEERVARKAFTSHRAHCKGKVDRNGLPVEMRLTFEDWFQLWTESGHWLERGKSKGQYVMARTNDLGHYELGNVRITTSEENLKEAVQLGLNRGRRYPHRNSSPMKDSTKLKLSAFWAGRKFSSQPREVAP